MDNQELIDKLLDIAMWCEKQDRESKSDNKFYYWAQAIREARNKMSVVREIEDILPLEEGDDLVRRFAYNIMWDAKNHMEDKNWSWSDETKAAWKEIDDRLTDPMCIDFDIQGYRDHLHSEASNQNAYSKACDAMTSYHKGIESGLHIALRDMEKFTKKREKHE